MSDAHARIADNPFYVLALRPDCTRTDMERAGQKWLAMLDVGLKGAQSYATPLGGRERTADKVRLAMAELRDPERRLVHEIWAALDPDPERLLGREAPASAAEGPIGWEEAPVALGWRSRR